MSDTTSSLTGISCLPISAPTADGKFNIGAGFLIKKAQRLWLITAAHVPTNSQPVSDWANWPENIYVWVTPSTCEVLPLFIVEGSIRKPNFLSISSSGNRIHDFMALPIMPSDAHEREGLLSQFHVVRNRPLGDPVKGTLVVGFGFPFVSEKWPSAEPHRFDGRFLYRGGMVSRIRAEVKKGHSGGPVFTERGVFLGMTIGSDVSPGGDEQVALAPGEWIWDQLPS